MVNFRVRISINFFEGMDSMKIVIVGGGKVSMAVLDQLSREGHDLVLVDNNPEALHRHAEEYDVMVVRGNGASMATLTEAKAGEADLLIAATSLDEVNLLTCIFARKLGVAHTIARVRNPEYTEQLADLREELGLSLVINPEQAAAKEIFSVLQFPSFLARDTFSNGKVEIVELKIGEQSKLRDIPLMELYKIAEVKVLVCAVERQGEAFIPRGDFVLRKGDRIHVTAAATDLVRLVKNLNIETEKIESVMIVGGSRIAYYLSRSLIGAGVDVKIIEKDAKRCRELAELLPEATVIAGDGSEQSLLLEEGIEEVDALVTLTDMDEENIFLSLYGSFIGIPKTVTKVSRMEYAGLLETMSIDSVISPRLLVATDVVRYVRSMSNAGVGGVLTLHELIEDKVEALEFFASKDTRYLGTPLLKMPLRKDVLVACILRRGRAIIPKGDDVIFEGDSVVVVAGAENPVSALNELFED